MTIWGNGQGKKPLTTSLGPNPRRSLNRCGARARRSARCGTVKTTARPTKTDCGIITCASSHFDRQTLKEHLRLRLPYMDNICCTPALGRTYTNSPCSPESLPGQHVGRLQISVRGERSACTGWRRQWPQRFLPSGLRDIGRFSKRACARSVRVWPGTKASAGWGCRSVFCPAVCETWRFFESACARSARVWSNQGFREFGLLFECQALYLPVRMD